MPDATRQRPLWLFGEIDGQKKGGFDLVRIVK